MTREVNGLVLAATAALEEAQRALLTVATGQTRDTLERHGTGDFLECSAGCPPHSVDRDWPCSPYEDAARSVGALFAWDGPCGLPILYPARRFDSGDSGR